MATPEKLSGLLRAMSEQRISIHSIVSAAINKYAGCHGDTEERHLTSREGQAVRATQGLNGWPGSLHGGGGGAVGIRPTPGHSAKTMKVTVFCELYAAERVFKWTSGRVFIG